MKRIVKILLITGAVSVFFFSGVIVGAAIGAYYRAEIVVLWRGFFPEINDSSSQAPAVDENSNEATSFVALPNESARLPLMYSGTLDEDEIQELLKRGAVVLPLGVAFGEPGNVVITAHSSGTAAFGPFRFAFAKLSELNIGDEFSITTPKATYRYRVYDKQIVWPHQVDKLPKDERSTVTLVTCWPLWTNFKRLLVNSELVGVDYRI